MDSVNHCTVVDEVDEVSVLVHNVDAMVVVGRCRDVTLALCVDAELIE